MVAWMLGLAVGLSSLTRWGLLLEMGPASVPLKLWPLILLKGAWFDLLVAGVWIAPGSLYESILPSRWRSAPWHRRWTLVWFWGFTFVLLFIAVLEIVFWQEFSTRLNFIAVDYLLYTQEVLGNIRESYPLGPLLTSLGLAAGGLTFLARKAVGQWSDRPLGVRERFGKLAWAIGGPLVAFGFGNIDQMRGFDNAYAEELSGNGAFTFAAALRRNELDYDRFYQTMPQEEADRLLKNQGVERSPLSAELATDMDDEASDPLPFRRRPKNIVLISVESLSASFLGAYGSTQGLTPHLDDLARRGLKFERLYATGTRTVRGLEALSLGIPPVPGQSVVRRPDNGHLSTLGEVLQRQGFSTFFFYGGYGYFDNMNAYFGDNDYEIIDRQHFPTTPGVFSNIWGVADEVLFDNVQRTLEEAAQRGRPFFAHIMTTSNHRPFTYPDGRIDIPSPGGREGAVKYTDYAIGRFIKNVEKRPWFKDTLFVLTADHCASAAGKTKLPLMKYHIPLILYAPDIVRPGVYRALTSQIDLPPSLIETLGKRGDDYFFGRSWWEPTQAPERAFISNYQQLGYFRDGILTVLLPERRVESYRIDETTGEQTPVPVDSVRRKEAIAYYQTAARAFKKGALHIPRLHSPS